MPKLLSFDTETSINCNIHGGDWRSPKNDIYTQIWAANPSQVFVRHSPKGYNRILVSEIKNMLKEMPVIVGVNLKFDLGYVWHDPDLQQWLKAGGQVWDCQLARYLLSGQRHLWPSLGELQKLYLGIKTKESRISALFKKKIGADKIIKARERCPRIWKLFNKYAKEDGKTPLLIAKKQIAEAKAKGMLRTIQMANRYLLSLCMMETNGIPVDILGCEKRIQEFTSLQLENIRKAEELCKQYWTDARLPILNLNSPQHASLILFGGDISVKVRKGTGEYNKSGKNKGKEKTKLFDEIVHIKGFQLPTSLSIKTKNGYYQTGEPIINKIYENSKNQLAIQYCKYKRTATKYKKMVSTYLLPFVNKSVDGKIHANFNMCETATTRLSSSAPNMQNIPKHGEWGKLIQGLLIAPEGWAAAQIDFSQLEVFCQAMLSNDRALINDLRNGVDFHCKRLCYIYPEFTYEDIVALTKGDRKTSEWSDRRSKAKVISFQKAYGAAPESLAELTKLPLDLIKTIFEKEDLDYCDVAAFDKSVAEMVQQTATVSLKSELREKDTKGLINPKTGFGRKFIGNVELLPIRLPDKKNYIFRNDEVRHVGTWQSPTGKLYSFEEFGSLTKRGEVFRYFKPTQMKNYMVQGSASDVQAITTIAMFRFLLENKDRVLMLNEIHDSKWFLIKKEYVSCILPKLCTIMNNTRQLLNKYYKLRINFDFACEAEVGNNFAEMEKFNE